MGLLAKLFGGRPKAEKRPHRAKRTSRQPASEAAPAPRSAPPAFSLLELGDEPGRRAELTPALTERAEALAEAALARFRSSHSDVPALPSVASEVMGLINDPESDINQLVRLINRDPGLAAQLLRVANSSAFGSSGDVESTRDACMRVGTKTVGEIVAATALRSSFAVESGAGSCLEAVGMDLWRRSLMVAQGAGWLAMRSNTNGDSLFLAGMLHNIGKAIGLRFLNELLDESEFGNDCLVHATVARVNDDIGAAVAQIWELPHQIAACCAYRYAPQDPADSGIVHTIRVAAGLNDLRVDPWFAEGLDRHVKASAEALKLDVFTLRALHSELRGADERIRAMFG